MTYCFRLGSGAGFDPADAVPALDELQSAESPIINVTESDRDFEGILTTPPPTGFTFLTDEEASGILTTPYAPIEDVSDDDDSLGRPPPATRWRRRRSRRARGGSSRAPRAAA